MKTPEYHQSELQTFLKCGKQWEFRYVQKIKTPPKAALTIGSSVDAGVTRNLIQKVKSKTDMALSDVLDVYSADFDIRKTETEFDGDDPGQVKDIGASLLTVHHNEIAPLIQPKTVQEKFTIELDSGFNIGGTIDLTEEDGTVADTKTSKTKYAEDSIHRALQPAIYDFAAYTLTGVKPKAFRYDVLIKPTKTIGPRIQRVVGQVTEDDHIWFFDAVTNMHKAIQAGIALPAPEGAWWCSKDWCGYWDRCKGAKK